MVQRRAYLSKKTAPEIIRFQGLWSEMGDSNSRHLAPKPGAIPALLYPDMRVSADKHFAIIAKAAGECKHFLILKKN